MFHIKTGTYGQFKLDGQTVIGITDLTAGPDENWIVFYINKRGASGAHGIALLDIFQNHVFGFAKVPTQIVNKNFAIWAKEFDMVLNMGKATTHRFREGSHKWNYDGRSGFSTNFHFTGN